MSKLYVFGIGGTGSRVIKAMTMMFAAGVKLPNNFDVVVPIIIDPDSGNGNLTQTKDILKDYCSIRSKIKNPDDFYQQDIQSVADLLKQNSNGRNAFELALSGTQQNTFGEYIGVNSMSFNAAAGSDDQNFAKLLYSTDNLQANLNVGFKGNPNMGSVVLNQIIQSPDFLSFCQTFNQGDAIFIINSIFGGTGAAGFPLLLKNLRSNTNIQKAQYINNCEIGDITYLPYFSLQQPSEGFATVNPGTFDEKAKVALDYYNQTIIGGNQVNAIYFIGNQSNRSIENYAEGTSAQCNNAHFLELAGALAIFDFCQNHPLNNGNTIVKEFGVQSDNTQAGINLDDLDPGHTRILASPLVKYRLFTQYLTKGLDRAINSCRWTNDRMKLVPKRQKSPLNKNFFDSADFALVKRMNTAFDGWIDEMQDNKPSFTPFNKVDSHNIFELRNGKKPLHNPSCKRIDIENARLVTKPSIRENEMTLLFKMFSQSLESTCNYNNII